MAADPEWLERMRSIGSISRRSGDQVRAGRDEAGQRFKATTDELGNTVTERSGDRQDVTINAPRVTVQTTTHEER
ncbi:hypothetical protein [Actinomadura decatromicini]|uniref:Uncharacterized protein n=1 Tax=Actinomadura decatromicini TaxID=2604572 RepID=A0A5D3FBR9_9ACTN|nr:hypothetical protein [Actinomadura decatromicini]TYK45180.1 hypothetical protein FXF68_31370 [Actinomadura decatromicini]